MAAEVLEKPTISLEQQPDGSLYVTEASLYNRPETASLTPLTIQEDLGEVATKSSVEPIRASAVETASPEGYYQSKSRRVVDAMRASRFGKIALPSLAGLALAGTAEASTNIEAPPSITITHKTTTTEFDIGKSRISEEAFSKAIVVGNYRTISKARVRRDVRRGVCDKLTARQVIKRGIRTQGYNGSGVGYYPDNRPGTFCDTDGDGDYDYRAECGNRSIEKRPVPKEAKSIIWVNNFSKAKVKVNVQEKITARAKCETTNTYAEGLARGSGKASAWIRLKNAIKANGKRLRKVVAKQELDASAEAHVKLRASANAKCYENSSKETTTTTTTVVTPPQEQPPQPPQQPPQQPPKPPEQPPKPPQPKPNLPPSADVVGPQHVLVGGEVQICAYESDPEGDIVSRNFSEIGNGNFISHAYPGDEAGEWCINYKAGTAGDYATVTYSVVDSVGNTAQDSESFEIYDGPKGQFRNKSESQELQV